MFSLSIVFGDPATSWRFLFRTKEAAQKVNDNIVHFPSQDIVIEDDFGQSAYIKAPSIHGRMLEDLDLSQQVHIEMALYQARMQAKAQQQGDSDEMLKSARLKANRQPSVFTPSMGRNGGF